MRGIEFVKRGAVLVLSGILACSATVDAMAEDTAAFPYTYTSYDQEYVFEKLSHPDKAPTTADGIVDYVGGGLAVGSDAGQGDRGQNYSWSAVAYEDSQGEQWVYVGTNYNAMGSTLSLMGSALGNTYDPEIMKAALDAAFNGTFFNGEEDGGVTRGLLVKVNINTGETRVLMSMNTTGQGPMFRNAIEFNGKLYFCGSVIEARTRCSLPSIWEVDPETDAVKCVHYGITPEEFFIAYQQGICTGIRGMAEFNDQLIISSVGVTGPYIAVSADPSSGNFVQIADLEDLFGYPAYRYCDSIYGGSIWEIIPYNGSLYVSLCTGKPENRPDEYSMQSFAIVRGDCNGDPSDPTSWTWTSLVGDQEKDGARYTFGIDPERTRAGACTMYVYDGYLYIGEYNDVEIALEDILFKQDFNFVAKNLEQSVSLYRMDADENIELIMGDATSMFPEGGMSGMESGFGGLRENQYIWQMTEYEGKLYMGTFDNSSLLEPIGQFSNGDLLHMSAEEWDSQINYLKVLIQLLIEKNTPPETEAPEEETTEEETTVEEIIVEEATIEEIIAEETTAEDTSVEETDTLDVAESLAKSENLSSEQVSALKKDLAAKDMKPGSMSEKTAEKVAQINESLEDLSDLLDSTDIESFADVYEMLMMQIEELKGMIPETVIQYYEQLLQGENLQNMRSLITCLKILRSAQRGFDMYVTEDGVNLTAITNNGMGDPYNHGLRVFASTPDWMVIGTANPFYGTQLWRMAGSGADEPEDPAEPENPEDPAEPGKPSLPPADGADTGDIPMAGWYAVMLASGTVAAMLRKGKKEE